MWRICKGKELEASTSLSSSLSPERACASTWHPGPAVQFHLESHLPVPQLQCGSFRAGGVSLLSSAAPGSAALGAHPRSLCHDLLQHLSNCVWSKPFSNGLPLSNTHLSCYREGEQHREAGHSLCQTAQPTNIPTNIPEQLKAVFSNNNYFLNVYSLQN